MFKSLITAVKGFFGSTPVQPVQSTVVDKHATVMQAPYKVEPPVVKQPVIEIVPELTVQPKKKAAPKKAPATKPATKKRAPKKTKSQ